MALSEPKRTLASFLAATERARWRGVRTWLTSIFSKTSVPDLSLCFCFCLPQIKCSIFLKFIFFLACLLTIKPWRKVKTGWESDQVWPDAIVYNLTKNCFANGDLLVSLQLRTDFRVVSTTKVFVIFSFYLRVISFSSSAPWIFIPDEFRKKNLLI